MAEPHVNGVTVKTAKGKKRQTNPKYRNRRLADRPRPRSQFLLRTTPLATPSAVTISAAATPPATPYNFCSKQPRPRPQFCSEYPRPPHTPRGHDFCSEQDPARHTLQLILPINLMTTEGTPACTTRWHIVDRHINVDR